MPYSHRVTSRRMSCIQAKIRSTFHLLLWTYPIVRFR